MKRTWKDAAVEVAFNKIKRFKPNFLIEGIYISDFLKGDSRNLSVDSKIGRTKDIIENTNFNDFRAAFMRWLEENEQKK